MSPMRPGTAEGRFVQEDTQSRAGLPLETGATRPLDHADNVYLMPRERGQAREAAMHEYLTWEINLVKDMAQDDDQRFGMIG